MATEVIDAFPAQYRTHLLRGQRAKLGLRDATPDDDAADAALADDWLALLHAGRVDFTLAWRRLADAAAGDEAPLRALFADAARARCVARALARALRERGRGAQPAQTARPTSARRAHAQRQSVRDRPQPSRRGGAGRRVRRR